MRAITALTASIALHAGLAAIPAHSPLPGESGPGPVASLSVRLPARPGAARTGDAAGGSSGRQAARAAAADVTEAGSILSIPYRQYFGPREVTERAVPLDDPLAREAAALRDFPGYGKLVLLLYLSDSGRVDDVELAGSDIGAPEVERQIMRQVAESRFMPARIDGVAVKSRIRIEVVIKPAISGATSLD
jgi:hypothetical protein